MVLQKRTKKDKINQGVQEMTLTKPYEATFYIGNDSKKTFSFLFDEVSENFIKVIVKRIDGTIYTPTFSVDMELKEVVFGEDEITPTADDIICIYRDTPTIQDTQFNTLQGYNAKALENILSKIVAMIQEMKASGFSTQILQGEPWGLDLIKPDDDGASVQIDYQARVLKKGLYFKMSDGNLQASVNGVDFVQMPKSAEVKEFRHRLDADGNVHFEYRVDKDWIAVSTGADVSGIKSQVDKNTADIITINGKLSAVDAQIDANADAIQKTREDFASADQAIRDDMNAEDSRLQTQITAQATAITTNKNDIDELGDDLAEIQAKIPESASGSNPLITKQQLLDEEMDIRDDVNEMVGELQTQITAQAGAIAGLDSEKLDKNQGDINAGKYLVVGNDGNIELTTSGGGGGGGISSVAHDETLSGAGIDASPLGLATAIKDEIADKAPKETVEALTQVINGIIGDYVKKSGDTMTGALNVPEITVQTAEGTFTVSVVAGVVTIATNNGLDIVAQTKFDTAPTTDDNTTWANALDTSLVRKAQVTTAIADALANIDALPDQAGNAGKVLTTDGTTASWQEPSGGTTITLKEYDE